MIQKLDRFLVRANQLVIGLMMLAMFVLVFVNVVGRYVFNTSFAKAEEVSTFLMIWVTYLGAGLALREGRHVAIDMFQDKLPFEARRALRIVLGANVLIFFAVLAYLGVQMSIFGWHQETIATQIPTGIPYLAIPLGALVFCMHLALTFRNWVERRWEKITAPEEPSPGEEVVS